MARGELLKKLFATYNRGDEFRSAAMRIIAEEEAKKNLRLARSLRKSLDLASSDQQNGEARSLTMVPQERDKKAPLLDVVLPSKRSSDIVLSRDNTRMLTSIIEEFRRAPLLRQHGLPVRSKLLFCGPPGCGKTLCAEVFAHEVGMPLLVTRFDALVSSYLGETASNLRTIFDHAIQRPAVLFFDEFDAIAKARDDISEHGELKRVVNSFLQLLDRHVSHGFVVAATNHEGLLDPAIWRRFDEVLLFDKPTRDEALRLIQSMFKNFQATFELESKVGLFEDFSHAEIERVCIRAIKQAIIRSKAEVSDSEFDRAYETERHRRQIVDHLNKTT